jgi:carnitine O-acetyltransferase
LDVFILDFEAFGKNFPKSQKVSPDAFVQIAMQLAFYRAHNKPGNTYESGSLRKFHLGRTDIIRTCGVDAVEFVKEMSGSNEPSEDKAKLLLKAINSHRLYTNSVINCESFDRHLLGLKLIAIENNIDLPEIYTDVAYQRACHYLISSSQVSSKFEAVTSYGPAVEDGYGACYNITEKKISFGLSAYRSSPNANTRNFGVHIQNALIDCQNLLLKVNHKL